MHTDHSPIQFTISEWKKKVQFQLMNLANINFNPQTKQKLTTLHQN